MTSEDSVPRLNGSRASESFVCAEALWEGAIVTEGDVRVEGTIHGQVRTDGSLTVAAGAHINGEISARKIVLAGDMQGQVLCDERLELLTGSSLGGDIETG